MTPATLEHEEYCLPRPGEDEPRIESYTSPRYADPSVYPTSHAFVTRCMECGAQVVQG